MLVTHNAMEILFTPGRVTMLGESDGNRLRRIYTDGRGHPDDAGAHIPRPFDRPLGRRHARRRDRERPAAGPLAVSEAAGVPNNGDMQVIERIHLADKDILHDDLEIIAPKI